MIISEMDHLRLDGTTAALAPPPSPGCCDAAGPCTLVAWLRSVSHAAMTWEFGHATVSSRD
jgi:hypothetical protein